MWVRLSYDLQEPRFDVQQNSAAIIVMMATTVSVARWSRPNSTEKCVEKAPFTVKPAIVNVVEGCNMS